MKRFLLATTALLLMTVLQVYAQCPNNEIWYTSINCEVVEPTKKDALENTYWQEIVSNYYKNDMGVIVCSEPITTIGDYAFNNCPNLTSITIPEGVTSIGIKALSQCSNLTDVTIPNSVTTIRTWAFSYCSSLTNITIPNSVETIGFRAFAGCDSLTCVSIPNSVMTLGESAFSSCKCLKEFNGKYASNDGRCLMIDGALNSFAPAGLTDYDIPNNVTTIQIGAFRKCENLISVIIPECLLEIGDYAFYDCSSLLHVYCKATIPPAGGSSMFHNNASDRKIYVPRESVEAYKNANDWKEYADQIVGYDF